MATHIDLLMKQANEVYSETNATPANDPERMRDRLMETQELILKVIEHLQDQNEQIGELQYGRE